MAGSGLLGSLPLGVYCFSGNDNCQQVPTAAYTWRGHPGIERRHEPRARGRRRHARRPLMNTCSHQSTLARGSGSVAGPAGYIMYLFSSLLPLLLFNTTRCYPGYDMLPSLPSCYPGMSPRFTSFFASSVRGALARGHASARVACVYIIGE